MAVLTGLFTLGADAEIRVTQRGDTVAQLRLAYNFGRDRQTQWLSASLWGKRAEALQPHLVKGTKIFAVIDDVCVQTFTKRDNSTGFALIGSIQSLDFASSKREDGPNTQTQTQRSNPQTQPQQQNASADMDFDDIPF